MMRYRWFHKPELHTSLSGMEKRPSWLELFYDLIFVAAFIQLGNGLSSHIDLPSLLEFFTVFTALWFAWTGYTFYSNRFNVDDFLHRFLVFLQIIAVGAMAVFAPQVLQNQPEMFSYACAFSQLVITILYVRSWLQTSDTEAKGFSIYWGGTFFVGSLLWFASALDEPPVTYFLWGIGIAAYIAAPFSRLSRVLAERSPYDMEHLTERYGILTIIVLGESFVKVVSTMAHGETDIGLFGQSAFTLLIAFSIWWIYFDDVADSILKRRLFSFNFWLYGHIPLHAAIVALGVAISKAAAFDLSAVAEAKYRWLLSGSLAGAYLSVALIDSMTERRHSEVNDRIRVNARLFSGILLLCLAPAGRGMTSGLFLTIIAIICAAQVVFDMMMAPLEFSKHEEEHPTIAKLARDRLEGKTVSIPRSRLGEYVRKGAPSEFRRDLYVYFIDGPWWRFLASLITVYFLFNVFFAALYMLDENSIANARPNSFMDAFFFSVQTMATIGYGVLNPASTYGNILASAEAAIALTGVAVVTGLMFAKVSRPKAGVAFSRPVLVSKLDGKPTLMFRVGNVRGNDIVAAEISVSVLKDEISPEGKHLRRVTDLKLKRHRTPFFNLSWLVMHEVDETSPFFGLTSSDDVNERIYSMVCMLTGHDSTYGQTTYSRHVYYPEDFRYNSYFVDVISQLPDGRLMVDFAKLDEYE